MVRSRVLLARARAAVMRCWLLSARSLVSFGQLVDDVVEFVQHGGVGLHHPEPSVALGDGDQPGGFTAKRLVKTPMPNISSVIPPTMSATPTANRNVVSGCAIMGIP
jgi:hypothetical protein